MVAIEHQHGGMFAGEKCVCTVGKTRFQTCKQLNGVWNHLIPDSFLYLLLPKISVARKKLPYLRLLISSRDEVVKVRVVGCHFCLVDNQ